MTVQIALHNYARGGDSPNTFCRSYIAYKFESDVAVPRFTLGITLHDAKQEVPIIILPLPLSPSQILLLF